MKLPSLGLVVAINRAVRQADEWFDEADDLDRVERALASVEEIDDTVTATAVLAFRITRAQAFGEGNKRTALLLARWILDQNGEDGVTMLPPVDREFAGLLIKAASGLDVEAKMVSLLRSRKA